MKEAYTTPTMEVVAFSSEDVITTSGAADFEAQGIVQSNNELPITFDS